MQCTRLQQQAVERRCKFSRTAGDKGAAVPQQSDGAKENFASYCTPLPLESIVYSSL